MSDKAFGKYVRTETISLATYKKYYRRKRYHMSNVVGAWYKIPDEIKLHYLEGGYVDQAVFSDQNPLIVLQGYVFKVVKE